MTDRLIYCIIVAAGTGSRFGSELPKQFCTLDGRPVLMHTIDRFRSAMPETRIIIVLNHDHMQLWEGLCRLHNFKSPAIVFGGKTRWESVKNAIVGIELPSLGKSIVMVHDGARPIVSSGLLERVVTAASTATGVIPVVPVSDSLRELMPDGTSSPADRARFRAVQTPQAFDGRLLLEAYRLPYSDTFTDDASVMAAAGHPDTLLVDGDPRNIKITHPDDIKIAELYLDR